MSASKNAPKKAVSPQKQPITIPVKDAVQAAFEHLQTVVPSATSVMVEETKLQSYSNARPEWLITLSFTSAHRTSSPFNLNGPDRVFKAFTIDAFTGQVKSMLMHAAK